MSYAGLEKTKNKDKNTSAGFTIVETIIVIAIAGVILLVVFEALPALLVNSRNNQRRQDVSNILQATSHYELNNSGNFPPDTSYLSNTKLTYYTLAEVSLGQLSNATQEQPVTDTSSIVILDYSKCDTINRGAVTNNGADYSNITAQFALDTTSSGVSPQCEQL